MDRNRATSNIRAGLWVSAFALVVFAATFFVAVLYLA